MPFASRLSTWPSLWHLVSCLLYPRAAFSLCVLLLQACKSAACASLVYSLYPGRSGALSGFHDHGHPKDLLCVLRTFLVQYLYISETLLVYLLQKPCTPHIQRSCVPCTSLCSSHAHLLYCTYMLCASLGHLLYNFCTSLSHFFPHTMHTRCSVYTCSAQPSDMPCTNLVYPLYTPPPSPYFISSSPASAWSALAASVASENTCPASPVVAAVICSGGDQDPLHSPQKYYAILMHGMLI